MICFAVTKWGSFCYPVYISNIHCDIYLLFVLCRWGSTTSTPTPQWQCNTPKTPTPRDWWWGWSSFSYPTGQSANHGELSYCEVSCDTASIQGQVFCFQGIHVAILYSHYVSSLLIEWKSWIMSCIVKLCDSLKPLTVLCIVDGCPCPSHGSQAVVKQRQRHHCGSQEDGLTDGQTQPAG